MPRVAAVLAAALLTFATHAASVIADDSTLSDLPALLHELAPEAKRLVIFWDARAPQGERDFYRVWDAARAQGLMPIGVELVGPAGLDAAFERARGMRAGLLVLLSERLGPEGLARVAAYAAAHALPAVSVQREFVAAGGLMSLGANGALVLNLKAARALGLAVPPAIRERAAEVLP
jgi:hypothetical protein